jgi:anti-anti-sigma factor
MPHCCCAGCERPAVEIRLRRMAAMLPSDMIIESAQRDGALVVSLRGEIDLSCVAELTTTLTRALSEATASHMVIDMTELGFLDSSGLGAIVSFHRQHPDVSFTLAVDGGVVGRLMEVTAMDQVFRVCSSVDEALSA